MEKLPCRAASLKIAKNAHPILLLKAQTQNFKSSNVGVGGGQCYFLIVVNVIFGTFYCSRREVFS